MTDEQLKEIESRATAATDGPWQKCTAHDGKCMCTSIWSIPADAPVLDVNKAWGDGLEGTDSWCEYGRFTEEAFQANKEFIAHAREDIPALIAEIKRLLRESTRPLL